MKKWNIDTAQTFGSNSKRAVILQSSCCLLRMWSVNLSSEIWSMGCKYLLRFWFWKWIFSFHAWRDCKIKREWKPSLNVFSLLQCVSVPPLLQFLKGDGVATVGTTISIIVIPGGLLPEVFFSLPDDDDEVLEVCLRGTDVFFSGLVSAFCWFAWKGKIISFKWNFS